MKPYWLKTTVSGLGATLGIGITARSEEDAKFLFNLAFGLSEKCISIVTIKDMAEVDQNHVIPNMGNHLKRGIWFPKGYEHISG